MMAHQVLARKWRSQTFEQVVGQTPITRSLQNALTRDKLGHAYLFCGTRGVGKTSVARIFSKAICCENRAEDGNPCLVCSSCQKIEQGSHMDVLEIDGASHNGVEHIRTIIDNVQYLPANSKYKIYIIDEVHMLSVNAFNALLKTLEEPPAHVIFIFATTTVEKLLGTVLSRVLRFDFRHLGQPDLLEHLKYICAQEKITYESESILKQVCKEAKGSARDCLSLFDQVLSYTSDNHVTEEALVSSLGIVRTGALIEFVGALLDGDDHACSAIYHQFLSENIEVARFSDALLDYFYELIVNDSLPNNTTSAELFWIYETLTKDLDWALKSFGPERSVEIVLRKIAKRKSFFTERPENQDKQDKEDEGPFEQPLQALADVVEDKESDLAPPLESLKKIETEIAPVEEVVKLSEADQPPKDLSWDGLIGYLYDQSPASAANLEQGNILGDLDLSGPQLQVRIGFNLSGKVFLDYLSEKETFERLKNNLSHYFGYAPEKIELKLIQVDSAPDGQEQFRSRVEIEEEKQRELNHQREQEILNDPRVLEAIQLFNSQVDKVILNEQG